MIKGKNIKLRDWLLQDLPAYEYWHLGRKKWMDFDGPYYPKPTEQELQERITDFKQKINNKNWPTPRKQLAVASLVDDQLLGTVSWYWVSEETYWKAIGIIIYDEQNWGKGIGYEALNLWVDYLFTTAKEIVRLDIRTWSGNVGMMQLAKKSGFIEEARFRKARIVRGLYYDSIGMGLLREEWAKGNQG